jgi:hypothetical protein
MKELDSIFEEVRAVYIKERDKFLSVASPFIVEYLQERINNFPESRWRKFLETRKFVRKIEAALTRGEL